LLPSFHLYRVSEWLTLGRLQESRTMTGACNVEPSEAKRWLPQAQGAATYCSNESIKTCDGYQSLAISWPCRPAKSQNQNQNVSAVNCNHNQIFPVASREELNKLAIQTREIGGVHYPAWFKEDAIRELQSVWSASQGDVFIVCHFPLRGLQRLLVSLVEGRDDPWAEGLTEKPHFCDAAASRRGVSEFLNIAASWKVRRCFKTHAFPHMFPCKYPFETKPGNGPPPKVLVMIADPRHAFTVWWQVMSSLGTTGLQLPDLIESVVTNSFDMFGNFFEHAAAWAREAMHHPDSVYLVDVGHLGSQDPKEVKQALTEIAEFLDIPEERAETLTAALFHRPAHALDALKHDAMPMLEALHGGPLVEQSGKNLHLFEDALAFTSAAIRSSWEHKVRSWETCPNPLLLKLSAITALGVLSTPPLKLIRPLKGVDVHLAGECRPCVFALRGVCRDSPAMCRYCHADGHARTKRASHHLRKLRKARNRTPSPDGLST